MFVKELYLVALKLKYICKRMIIKLFKQTSCFLNQIKLTPTNLFCLHIIYVQCIFLPHTSVVVIVIMTTLHSHSSKWTILVWTKSVGLTHVSLSRPSIYFPYVLYSRLSLCIRLEVDDDSRLGEPCEEESNYQETSYISHD